MLIDIDTIPLIRCDRANYRSSNKRPLTSIKYIVVHYTGNKNDTAKNNCYFFRNNSFTEANKKRSAHYFVSDKEIICSVPIDYTAYSIGGTAGQYGSTYNGICTNSNSISIEMCGSKTSTTSSEITQENCMYLIISLCYRLNIPIQNVIRHYDVTGKECPAFLVNDTKWKWFKTKLKHLYRNMGDIMVYDDKNYAVFKQFMNRYIQERSKTEKTWGDAEWAKMCSMKAKDGTPVMDGKSPNSWVTRLQLAAVVTRTIEAVEKMLKNQK